MKNKTLAYTQAVDILKACELSVVVGSNSFYNDAYTLEHDTDIAVNFEDLIYNYIDKNTDCSLRVVRRKAPSRPEDDTIVYSNNGIVSQCIYRKNENTLWLGVESIMYPDSSRLDILYYTEKGIQAVKQTVPMLLARNDIWTPKAKEKRVRLFETLVKTNYDLIAYQEKTMKLDIKQAIKNIVDKRQKFKQSREEYLNELELALEQPTEFEKMSRSDKQSYYDDYDTCRYIYGWLLLCNNAIDYNDVSYQKHTIDQTKAYPSDMEAYSTELYVGKLFGCVNFCKKINYRMVNNPICDFTAKHQKVIDLYFDKYKEDSELVVEYDENSVHFTIIGEHLNDSDEITIILLGEDNDKFRTSK